MRSGTADNLSVENNCPWPEFVRQDLLGEDEEREAEEDKSMEYIKYTQATVWLSPQTCFKYSLMETFASRLITEVHSQQCAGHRPGGFHRPGSFNPPKKPWQRPSS